MKYALVNTKTSRVENIIEIDNPDEYPIPDGYELISSDIPSIGWIYEHGLFNTPTVTD